MNYSEEDLATLTAEERAVILEDDGAAEANRKALAAIADGGDDDDEDDDDADNDTASNDDSAAADDAARDVPAAASGQQEEEIAEKRETFRPQYVAQVPADFAEKLAGIDSEIDSLANKFKSGDIEFDEFQLENRKLENQRLELHNAKTKAEISQEMSQQTAVQEWKFTINKFMKDEAKVGGIDYAKDQAKLKDFDQFVKILGADPENENRDPEWFLIEANKRVKALHGIAVTAPAKPDAQKQASRKAPVDNLPKTLAQVPGGDGPGDVGDEFAHIDKLSGDKLEAAIAAMSPAQRERYMTGS